MIRTERGFSFVIVIVLCIFQGCGPQNAKLDSTSNTPPKIIAEFSIPKNGRLITLPVRINRKEYLFALDTGCISCVFDDSFRSKLGNRIYTKTLTASNGSFDADYFSCPDAYLGELNLKDAGPVICINLEMIRYCTGQDVYGIIGMSFLAKYVVQIDFDHGNLKLLQSDSVIRPVWGQHVPINCSSPDRIPKVEGQLLPDLENVTFILDTGSNSACSLKVDIYDAIVKKHALKNSEILTETVLGTSQVRETRIKGISIAGITCNDPIATESMGSSLGLNWFSRFHVTFDFPNQKMYLVKGEDFNRYDNTNMSGLRLDRVDGCTIVSSIEKGSPADEAGIIAGDVIISINGTLASHYDLWELCRLLRSGDKKKIKIDIARAGEVLTKSLVLIKKI